MTLRQLVASLATTALVFGACGNKTDSAPNAAPTAKTDKDKPTEAAPEVNKDEVKEAKTDEAVKIDEAAPKTDEAVKIAAPVKGGDSAKGDEGDAMKRAIVLQKDALAILKANKGDAKAAAAALDVFQRDHADELATLEKDLRGIQESLKKDPSQAMKMMSKYADEISEITKLTMELSAEAPNLLNDPAVAKALQKLSPNPDKGDGGSDGEVQADPAGTSALTEADEQLLELGLTHQEKMLELLAANADDPAKAGEVLMKYAEENAPALAKLGDVQKRLAKDNTAAMSFAKKHMARVSAMAMKISTLVKEHPTLLTDEKIAAAMAKLSGN